jgi:hypothetical protein
MAEQPEFFTVAPWGYRILPAWLAGAFPGVGPVRGFRLLAWASLLGAGVLLFKLLRRFGHGEGLALLGVAFYALSGPVGEALDYPFVADPLCLLLLILFLIGLEARVGLPALALVAVLGALTKEILLAELPLLLVAARSESRGLKAWLSGALAALPALAVTLALRAWWTPYLAGSPPSLGAAHVTNALTLIAASWRQWWAPALVGGLVPLACLGALRPVARPYLLRYGYLLVAYCALPFVAGAYVGTEEQPRDFFSGDVPRLMLHAVPLLIPLALLAVDVLRPQRRAPPPPAPWPRWARRAAVGGCIALILAPFIVLDRYRRIDLSGQRDGLVVLATIRESLRAAARLERDRAIVFAPEEHRWVPGKFPAPLMGQMRWFLREGFGPQPQYGVRDIFLRTPDARILVPSLAPRALELAVRLSASPPETVAVAFNGRPLARAAIGDLPTRVVVDVPQDAVLRGDNVLTLGRSGDTRPGPRVLLVEVRPR